MEAVHEDTVCMYVVQKADVHTRARTFTHTHRYSGSIPDRGRVFLFSEMITQALGCTKLVLRWYRRGCFPTVKAAGAWSWSHFHLVPKFRMSGVALYVHSHMRFYVMHTETLVVLWNRWRWSFCCPCASCETLRIVTVESFVLRTYKARRRCKIYIYICPGFGNLGNICVAYLQSTCTV
jgi:hypothetical protein